MVMSTQRFFFFFSLLSDIYYFLEVYDLATSQANFKSFSYKIVLFMTFNSIVAPYLIAYSGLIALKYKSGDYDPSGMMNTGRCGKTLKFLFLTVLGPLTLFIKQIVEAIGDIFALPLIILTLN